MIKTELVYLVYMYFLESYDLQLGIQCITIVYWYVLYQINPMYIYAPMLQLHYVSYMYIITSPVQVSSVKAWNFIFPGICACEHVNRKSQHVTFYLL